MKIKREEKKRNTVSLLESIGSDLEELGKRVICLLLFSAGKVLEVALVEERIVE